MKDESGSPAPRPIYGGGGLAVQKQSKNMKYLKIQNKGVLDIRLVALMGGTTKSKDEFKIGQFGTGLKYTLAFLVRNNIDFHLFCGASKTEVKIETEKIYEEDFNIICINGNRTSITDRMGLEWQAWMIIRELWCNALDEGEALKEETTELTGEEGKTTFYLQITSEIAEVLKQWDKYFIHEKEPMFSSQYYSIYPGGEDLRIYKQGVLIHQVPGKKSLFNYDVKNATINELREFKGSLSHCIFKCLQHTTPKIIDYFLSNCKEDHYEGSECDYNWFDSFGKQWKETIGEAKLISKEAVESITARGIKIDTTRMIITPKRIHEALTKNIEGINALRVSSEMNSFFQTFSSEAEEKVKQALTILESCGYNYHPELKFIYGIFGDKTINAQVNMDSKEVYISEAITKKSMFEIVYILIEENEHFETEFSDCSRDFQTHFIKLYTKQLLNSKGIQI